MAREDYPVKEAHASTPPPLWLYSLLHKKTVRCHQNGKASLMKASNLSRTACTVPKKICAGQCSYRPCLVDAGILLNGEEIFLLEPKGSGGIEPLLLSILSADGSRSSVFSNIERQREEFGQRDV
jgi:hypothetical protein